MNPMSSLYVFVLCVIIGLGGWLRAESGREYGWLVLGVTMVVHTVNCIGLHLLPAITEIHRDQSPRSSAMFIATLLKPRPRANITQFLPSPSKQDAPAPCHAPRHESIIPSSPAYRSRFHGSWPTSSSRWLPPSQYRCCRCRARPALPAGPPDLRTWVRKVSLTPPSRLGGIRGCRAGHDSCLCRRCLYRSRTHAGAYGEDRRHPFRHHHRHR